MKLFLKSQIYPLKITPPYISVGFRDINKTPRAGFEPATNRLTADRSTAELPRKELKELTLDEGHRASHFNLRINSRPLCQGPNFPFFIMAAPSQYSSSSIRCVIHRAAIGFSGRLESL